MILVAGATGAVGFEVCQRLRARGKEVRALVRTLSGGERGRALAALGVELAPGELSERAGLDAAADGVEAVVSTATSFPRDRSPGAIERVDAAGNIALVDAAERAGAGRFVFTSFRPVALDFPLQRARRAVEQRLALAELDGVALRPGKFMDVWFSPLCGFDVGARRATIFGDGTRAVTWIAAADVAEIAARSALGDGPRRGTIELGGPDAVSQRQVVAIYEELAGSPFALEVVPAAELERRRREATDDVTESLSSLMLEAHLGAVTEPAATLRHFPVQLTTVREFAERSLALAAERR